VDFRATGPLPPGFRKPVVSARYEIGRYTDESKGRPVIGVSCTAARICCGYTPGHSVNSQRNEWSTLRCLNPRLDFLEPCAASPAPSCSGRDERAGGGPGRLLCQQNDAGRVTRRRSRAAGGPSHEAATTRPNYSRLAIQRRARCPRLISCLAAVEPVQERAGPRHRKPWRRGASVRASVNART